MLAADRPCASESASDGPSERGGDGAVRSQMY